MSCIIRKERIEMKEWVTSRGIVCCTKEIELLKWIHLGQEAREVGENEE